MAPTLGAALAALVRGQTGMRESEAMAQQPSEAGTVGGASPRPAASAQGGLPAPAGSIQSLVQRANQAYDEAIRAQRQGDWSTYGARLQQLQATLRELER